MAVAIPASMLVVRTDKVTRRDGSCVKIPGSTSWTSVVKSLLQRLRSDPHIIALFPMFFVSNFYFPYMFNDINLANFNIRTRALNIILFYTAGIAGATVAGHVLDAKFLRRTVRIKIGLAMLFLGFTSIWFGALAWQHPISRAETKAPGFRLIDCTERTYLGPLFLFLAFGFVHFIFQNCNYYFMTALADCSKTASMADFAGLFKSIQAVGVAVSWKLSNLELPFMTDLIIAWSLTIGCISIAAPTLIVKVQDTGVASLKSEPKSRSDSPPRTGSTSIV